MRQADLIAVMECDLLDEAPMMALAVRQAWRNGARVFIVGSECPIDAAQTGTVRKHCGPIPLRRAAGIGDQPGDHLRHPPQGTGSRSGPQRHSGARLAFILDGPNAFGCALLAVEHGALPLSRAVADKRVKGIISFEADLPDELLEGITVIGAADWRPTGAAGPGRGGSADLRLGGAGGHLRQQRRARPAFQAGHAARSADQGTHPGAAPAAGTPS